MTKQTVFLSYFLLHSLSAHNCFTMQTEPEFKKIDQELYSKIVKIQNHPIIFLAPISAGEVKYLAAIEAKYIHKEGNDVVNAINAGRALYYTKGQGAIIYNNTRTLSIEQVQPFVPALDTRCSRNSQK